MGGAGLAAGQDGADHLHPLLPGLRLQQPRKVGGGGRGGVRAEQRGGGKEGVGGSVLQEQPHRVVVQKCCETSIIEHQVQKVRLHLWEKTDNIILY